MMPKLNSNKKPELGFFFNGIVFVGGSSRIPLVERYKIYSFSLFYIIDLKLFLDC